MIIAQHLPFETLRRANINRLPLFKNAKGEPAHSMPDGSDWSIGDWFTALLGELGEAANLIKKLKRGDYSKEELLPQIADEFADVVCYTDLTAFRMGMMFGAGAQGVTDFGELREFNLKMARENRAGANRELGEQMAKAGSSLMRAYYSHEKLSLIPIVTGKNILSPEAAINRETRASFQSEIGFLLFAGIGRVDFCCIKLGIDLASATAAKFNTVSKRVGANVFINVGGEVVTDVHSL